MFAIEEILGLVKNRDSHNKEPLFGKKKNMASCTALFKKLKLEYNAVFDHEVDHEGLLRYILKLHLHTKSWF